MVSKSWIALNTVDSFRKQKQKTPSHVGTRQKVTSLALSPYLPSTCRVLPTPPLVPRLCSSNFVFGALLWRYREFKFKF
jgi:hypothetical protein